MSRDEAEEGTVGFYYCCEGALGQGLNANIHTAIRAEVSGLREEL